MIVAAARWQWLITVSGSFFLQECATYSLIQWLMEVGIDWQEGLDRKLQRIFPSELDSEEL